MRDFVSLLFGVPFLLAALSLLGCSSGSSPISLPQRATTGVPSVPAFSASSTGAASAVAGVVTISFPLSSGFGGDVRLPVSTVPANDTFAVVLSSSPPDGSSALSARRIQSVSKQTPIDEPFGVAVDGNGNVYVADTGNNLIRKITSAGAVTRLDGSGSAGSANGTGTAASFNQPYGVAVDGNGNVYVGDRGNNLIRAIH